MKITDEEAGALRKMAAEHAADDAARNLHQCRCDACYFTRHGELPTTLEAPC